MRGRNEGAPARRLLARRLIGAVLLAAVVLATRPAWSLTYFLATDVPARLGGSDFTPNQILRSDGVSYVLEAALPAGASIAALDRRPDGVWLFSPAHPLRLGNADYRGRDLVAFDGASFSLFLDGGAAGVPAYARIDALFLDAAGLPVLSFDVPVKIGGATYGRADLVRRDAGGGFSLFWGAATAGVPPYANLVGAALDGAGTLVVSFDVPVRLGGTEFLPGQLVRFAGGSFSNYFVDPSWPRSAQLRDFAFAPGAGAVANGGEVAGLPLQVSHAAAGAITLSWGAACGSGTIDYAVYEGALGASYNPASRVCSTGGVTTVTFTPPAYNSYYVVVPRNAVREGSYGTLSGGAERPPAAAACLPQEISACP